MTIVTTAESRSKLHDLIESLPSEDLPTALRILETLRSGPVPLSDVPIDDEPETEEEREAVAEARREIEEGKGIPHDEVMQRLGLA